MLCAFFVSLDLIKPGVAAERDGTPETQTTYHFETPAKAAPSGAENFQNNIEKIEVTVGGETYYSPDGENYTISIDAGNSDSTSIEFKLSYNYENNSELNAVLSSHYIYYTLPSDLKLQQSYYGADSKVWDTKYSTTEPSGYYSIEQTTGLVLIHFTPNYIAHLNNNKNGFIGDISFTANIERTENVDGDKTVNIGESGISVDVQFDDSQVTASKNGQIMKDASGNKYILWTITVNNPRGYVDMNGYSIEDVITKGGADVDWSNNISDVTISPSDSVTNDGDGKFTFNRKANYPTEKYPESVTITYKQKNLDLTDGTVYDNNATIKKEGKEDIPISKQIKIQNKLTLTKSGQPDYQIDDTSDKNKVKWHITVNNQLGDSLVNSVITDSELNNDGLEVYYLDASGSRVPVNYSLGDGTLKITDSNAPSSLYVDYYTTVDFSGGETSKTVSNTASVNPGPEVVNNPPSGSGDVTSNVTYDRKNGVSKTGSFSNETMKFSWKITAYSSADVTTDANGNVSVNVDQSSKKSLDGYKIQDDMFKGKTLEQVRELLSLKAFYAKSQWDQQDRTSYVSIALYDAETGTITLKVDTAVAGYDAATPPNKIEISYTTEMTEDQRTTYKNGESGSQSNTATATDKTGYSGSGTGTATFESRVDAKKVYRGDAKDVAIGNDTTPRTMSWVINLTKDAGFASEDMVVEDILSAKDANNNPIDGSHYITWQQARSISVTGFQSKSGGNTGTTIDRQYYEITFTGTDGNNYSYNDFISGEKNAKAFTIKFLDGIDAGQYHYMDIGYQTTADVSVINGYGKTKFTNTYSFGTHGGTENGLELERKDPSKVEYTTLKLTKTWNDYQNAFSSRPDVIKINVYQAEVTAEGTIPAANSEAWKLFQTYDNQSVDKFADNQTFTLAMAADEVFPQWNGTTGTRYCYRVEEVLDDGSTYTTQYNTESLIATSSESSFAITNTSQQPYGKRAIDKDGNTITTITTSNLPQVTINDQKYYVFGWDLLMYNKAEHTYHDTLPTADTICITKEIIDRENSLAEYEPKICYNNEGGAIEKLSVWSACATVKQDGQNLTIQTHNQANLKFLRYYTAIPVSSVLDGDKITNTIKRDNETTGYSATVDVVQNSSPVEDVNLITKTYTKGALNTLNYALDVNPAKKKLSNSATYDITDNLTIAQATNDLDLSLYKIDVYRVDDDGVVRKDDEHKLNANEFSYIVSCNTTESTPMTIGSPETLSNYFNATGLKVSGWKAGDKVSFKLDYSTTNSNDKPQIVYFDINGNLYWKNMTVSDNMGTYELTVPKNTANLYVAHFSAVTVSNVSASVVKDVPAKITFNVPDKEHLYIEYTYMVTGAAEKEVVKVNNSAKIHTDNADAEDSVSNSELPTDNSHATTVAKTFPKIYKVDVGNYGLNELSAKFRVAKYDGSSGKWVYASSVTTTGVGDNLHREITFPAASDTNYHESGDRYPANSAELAFAEADNPATTGDNESVHQFSLQSGLYKFVETESPGGNYRNPDWRTGKTFADNKEFVYYYNYAGYNGTIPTDIQNRVVNVLPNTDIDIPNNQNITVKATKTFSGTADKVPDVAEVTLKLYWSPNRNGSVLYKITGNDDSSYDLNVPSGFDATRTITYCESTNSCAEVAEWSALPSGKDGSPVYYFVQEISYTAGGTTYTVEDGKVNGFTPVYTGNGTNSDGTTVHVENAQGIVVRKLWQDLNGNTITPPTEINAATQQPQPMEIAFEVYGVNGTAKTKLPLTDAVLNESNNYEYSLPPTIGEYQLSQFKTFEVVEKLTDAQISALYRKFETDTTRKIKDGVGSLEIINTNITSSSTSASVQKVWRGDENDFKAVNVYLIQSKDSLNADQLKEIESGTLTTGFCIGENMLDGDEVKLIIEGKSKTISGVKAVKIADETVVSQSLNDDTSLTLTGLNVGNTEMTITKSDDSTETYTVSVIDPDVTLSATNNWKANWDKLPYTYKEDNTEGNYHYYVIEDTKLPEGYSSTYRINGTATIITNAKESALTVQKVWEDADGNTITLDESSASYDALLAEALPDTIQVELYQKPKTETIVGELHLDKPSSIKVAAYGDSITKGTFENYVKDSKTYPNVLESQFLTAANGYNNSTVYKIAENGRVIDTIKEQIQHDTNISSADIICVIAGTNDIINSNVAITSESGESLEGKMRNLIESFIGNNGANKNAVLMIGKIPRFTALTWSNSRGIPQGNNAENQKAWDDLVSTYNTMLENLVKEYKQQDGKKIVLVDVYTAVGNNLVDGCHPDEIGYQSIANAFYTEIEKIYVGADATTRENPVNISMPGPDADISTQFSGEPYGTYELKKSDGYKLEIKGLPEKNASGTEYVYYVKEVGTHVLNNDSYQISGNRYIKGVTYTNNGQTAQGEEVIYIKNKISTFGLAVRKLWADNGTHSSVDVHIYRSTNKSDALAAMSGKKLIPSPLTLSGSSLTLYVGDSPTTITANREDITIGSYDSAKLEVARTGSTLSFTPVAATESPLTITFTDGDGNTAQVHVTVVKPTFRFTLGQSTLTVGKTTESSVSVDHGELGNVEYESSDTSVATVDSNGNVKAIAPGTATITAKRGEDSVEQTITVTTKPTLSIVTAGTLTAGEEADFIVKLDGKPVTGYNVNIIQGSATVTDGKITATKVGTVQVVVSYPKDGETYESEIKEITVNLPDTFHIEADKATLTVGSSDTATLSVPEATYGGTYSYRKYSGSNNIILNGSTVSLENAVNNESAVFEAYRTDETGEVVSTNKVTITATAQESSEPTWTRIEGSYGGWPPPTIIEDMSNVGSLTIKLNSSGHNEPYFLFNDSYDAITLKNTNNTLTSIGYKEKAASKISCELSGNIVTITFLKPMSYLKLTTYDNAISFDYYTTERPSTNSLNDSPVQNFSQLDTSAISTTRSRQILRAGSLNKVLTTLEDDDSLNTIDAALAATAPIEPVVYSVRSVTAGSESYMTEFYVDTLTITSTDTDWTKSLSSLPAYDSNGNPYYYWAVEDDASAAGFEVSYLFKDQDPNSERCINADGISDAQITVKNAKTESSSTTLPESGGTGTTVYYYTGGLLLLLSAAGYVTMKRRKWFNK